MTGRGWIALAALIAPVAISAQAPVPKFGLARIAAPADRDAIPLWPMGSLPAGGTAERWGRMTADFPDGTHMDQRIVRNVAIPTMTPVLPDPAKATGAAVVVAPGGAFLSLSMDSEGFAIARWLADHGIAAFVLKYRLNSTPDDEPAFMRKVGETMGAAIASGETDNLREPRATQDALQALALIRQGAARWGIDPARVGMVGFSAGARTAMQAVLNGRGTAKPAFLGYIYGSMMPVAVPADAPPMFAALAMNDPLLRKQGFGIVDAWRQAGRPVELHAYERGDHGFGIGRPGTTSTLVMDEFRLWLATRGLLSPHR
ncbi:alpha/beta hydrolase [Sphingomonas montana]|uniref:alpha/beta hydrolase n=1 Tax=Sphingomonas montana TaxID=1843236 RepID=UPI00096EE7B5|nr:alpha/beta hydrolase [Sphingomonas montana]